VKPPHSGEPASSEANREAEVKIRLRLILGVLFSRGNEQQSKEPTSGVVNKPRSRGDVQDRPFQWPLSARSHAIPAPWCPLIRQKDHIVPPKSAVRNWENIRFEGGAPGNEKLQSACAKIQQERRGIHCTNTSDRVEPEAPASPRQFTQQPSR